jgi:PmbA protein
MTPDEHNLLPEDQGTTSVSGLFDPEIAKVSMDDKIALAKKVEQLAMSDSRVSKSGGASFSDGEQEIFLASSKGMSKSYKTSVCSYGMYAVAEKGDDKSTGRESCSRRFFADLLTPEEVAAEAVKSAFEMLGPKIVKTQRAPVIFDRRVARSIIGGVLGAVNGQRVLQGASFLKDKVGQKIAVEGMTLIDDGTRPKGLSSCPFDGEGVPTQKRTIVDKGVLKGFMYNTIVAHRAGVQSTGNASRRGYTSLPGIGAHSFYMEAGTVEPEEIIGATRRGLYLKGVTGGGINAVNGNYTAGARGFWIENGKIAFPVKDLTIAGSADEIFNSIDMIGSDLDLDRAATPTFRIKEMQIGGE